MTRGTSTTLTLPHFGYGAMSLAGAYGAIDEEESQSLLDAALEAGVTFIDTANIYGDGLSEAIVGRFIARHGRDAITLATKVGIVGGMGVGRRGIRGDRAHIIEQVELSLTRLGTDHIDLYYQHRIDPKVPVEETVAALAELVQAGKVGHIGLSEATGEELRRASAVHPIAAVQSEWNLFSRDVEQHVIPAAAELGITFVAFSPVSRGLLTDSFTASMLGEHDIRSGFPRFWPEHLADNVAIAREVTGIAEQIGISTEELAVAWIHTRAEKLGVAASVIPGTRSIDHLLRDLGGSRLRLTPEQMSTLDGFAARIRGPRASDPQWTSGGREGII